MEIKCTNFSSISSVGSPVACKCNSFFLSGYSGESASKHGPTSPHPRAATTDLQSQTQFQQRRPGGATQPSMRTPQSRNAQLRFRRRRILARSFSATVAMATSSAASRTIINPASSDDRFPEVAGRTRLQL